MGHLQQLAFALDPVEIDRTARPRRRAPPSKAFPAEPAAPPEPVPPTSLFTAARPAVAPQPTAPLPVAPVPVAPVALPPPVLADPERDVRPRPGGMVYVVVGFSRGRGRRPGPWQPLPEQGFPSRQRAEDHARRLVDRGQATGAIIAQRPAAADVELEDMPPILGRFGTLPDGLGDG